MDVTDNVNTSENDNVEEVDTDSVDGVHNVDESVDLGNSIAPDAEDNVIVDVDSPDVTVNVDIEIPESEPESEPAFDLVAFGNGVIAAINDGFAALSAQMFATQVAAEEAAETVEEVLDEEIAEEVSETVEPDEPPESSRAHWFFR